MHVRVRTHTYTRHFAHAAGRREQRLVRACFTALSWSRVKPVQLIFTCFPAKRAGPRGRGGRGAERCQVSLVIVIVVRAVCLSRKDVRKRERENAAAGSRVCTCETRGACERCVRVPMYVCVYVRMRARVRVYTATPGYLRDMCAVASRRGLS